MESATEKYDEERDVDRVTEDVGYKEAVSDMHFKAGQSKRVWGELYKVFAKSAMMVHQIWEQIGKRNTAENFGKWI